MQLAESIENYDTWMIVMDNIRKVHGHDYALGFEVAFLNQDQGLKSILSQTGILNAAVDKNAAARGLEHGEAVAELVSAHAITDICTEARKALKNLPNAAPNQ